MLCADEPVSVTILLDLVKVVTLQFPATLSEAAPLQVTVVKVAFPSTLIVPVDIVNLPVPAKLPVVPLMVRLFAPSARTPVPFTVTDIRLLLI